MNTRSMETASPWKRGWMRIRCFPSANGWILGSPRGCCPLKADIDELGFFDVALSQDQIAAVMGGVEALGAVEPSGKLATAWAQIKDRD